jgi:hypothetical protein
MKRTKWMRPRVAGVTTACGLALLLASAATAHATDKVCRYYNVHDENGGIMSQPRIFDVFLDGVNGNYWNANALFRVLYWTKVVNSRAFWSRLHMPWGVPFTFNDATVARILNSGSDPSITLALETLIANHTIPSDPTFGNAIYMVYVSPAATFAPAYHSSYFSPTANRQVPYAVIPGALAHNVGTDSASLGAIASRQLVNAITDPFGPRTGQHGLYDAADNLEVGDICVSLADHAGSITGGIAGHTVSLVVDQSGLVRILSRRPNRDRGGRLRW